MLTFTKTQNDSDGFVLSDIAMPDMSGYDVIALLNKFEEIPKIGIITGWDEGHDSLDDEDCKIDLCLKKHFNRAGLKNHINGLKS
jgi:DNA-binding LytR/AlgR family response regulator